MQRVGIRDTYGETGSSEYLFRKYGLTKDDIVSAARRTISRKEKRTRAS
jgi:transketolase